MPCVVRPVTQPRCCHGQHLAGDAEFAEQLAAAELEFDWMREHVRLLTRLQSGRPPTVIDLYCGAGGISEGVRRMGGAAMGVDLHDQPEFRARFGDGWFHQSDALDRDSLRVLKRRLDPVWIGSSSPCQFGSTASFGGPPSQQPELIRATRDALVELGVFATLVDVLAPGLAPH